MAKTDWKLTDKVLPDDLNQIGAEINAKETPGGAQDKADQAEQNAKDYTDHQIEDIQFPVTSVNNKTGDAVLTAEDVGLGNVDNLSAADIRSGTTKTNVGLGNVQNYGVATKAQAEAGTANNLYMTPLRTKEAILANNVPTRISNGEFQYFNGTGWVDVGCKFDKSAMTPISIDNKVITNSSGYTTVLDVNGKGYMDVITMGHMHSSSDAPAYLKVTVDGVVVLEAMTMSSSNYPVVGCISRNFLMSIASNGAGVYHPSTSADNIRISSNFRVVDAPFVYSDSTDYGGVIIYPDSLYFSTSLKVEISSRFSRGDVAYTISGGVME